MKESQTATLLKDTEKEIGYIDASSPKRSHSRKSSIKQDSFRKTRSKGGSFKRKLIGKKIKEENDSSASVKLSDPKDE